jgi:D-proline reductase (dithiol) PrdB
MPRLEQLPEATRNALLSLPVPVNETAPFTRLSRPLSACTLAIVTTAGLHLRDDRPFVGGDPSYRAIPSSVKQKDLLQSHSSIGFDRTLTQRDINIVFPIDRLRELVAQGEIGRLAPTNYSFMGAQRDWTKITTETAPDVARRLTDEGVDVVLLTPT